MLRGELRLSVLGKRVLVTGANGFVGSHLTEALLDRGYRVRCMVRKSSDLQFIQELPVEWAYAALGEADSLREACRDIDAVCHCAALTRALDQETFMRINAHAVESFARQCLEQNPGLRRFLFLSSTAAAGPSRAADDYVDEEVKPEPITWYGRSKLAAEQALRAMGERLPFTVVRAAPVFGPRDRDFLTYFNLVKRGLALKLGRQKRRVSLIYVADLTELIILALESDTALGETYYACGQAHSYEQFSEAIAGALGKRIREITVPESALTVMSAIARVQGRVTGRAPLLNDQRILDMRERYWLCSGAKARNELGFTPRYGLKEAVGKTADWYLAEGWL